MFNVYNTHRGHFQITHFPGTVEIEFTNKDYSYAPFKVDNELIKSYFPFHIQHEYTLLENNVLPFK